MNNVFPKTNIKIIYNNLITHLGELITIRAKLTNNENPTLPMGLDTYNNQSAKLLSLIKSDINKLFPDKVCEMVSICESKDKDFFGAIVAYNNSSLDKVSRYIFSHNEIDDEKRINEISTNQHYTLEIDSRLFELVDVIIPGITALLIQEIETITSKAAIVSLIGAYDWIISRYFSNRTCVNYGVLNYTSLAPFIVAHTLYTMNSIFYKDPSELCLASELIRYLELENDFNDAYETVSKMGDVLTRSSCPKTLMLNWLIANLSQSDGREMNCTEKHMIAKMMRHAYDLTDSITWKKLIRKTIDSGQTSKGRSQEYINSKDYVHITESKHRGLIGSMKYNGMKSLEDDLYEYSMRVKNIDDESSAILLMRQINSRIGIIYDYLESESLNETERKRWEKLYDKYDLLREEMIKKPIYSRKMYGLFTDYNALMNMNNPENMMTINTIY